MMQPFMTPQKPGSASYSTPQNRGQLSSNVESLRLQQAAVPETPKRLTHNPTNIAMTPAPLALPKKNYEHIIIDGGSTDKTLEIIKKYPGISRYTTMKNKKNTIQRLELKKFCSYCLKHTLYKEIK